MADLGTAAYFGSNGTLTVLTGVIIQSADFNASFELGELADGNGDVAGAHPFKRQQNITVSGYTPTAADYVEPTALTTITVAGLTGDTDATPLGANGKYAYVGPFSVAHVNNDYAKVTLGLRRYINGAGTYLPAQT